MSWIDRLRGGGAVAPSLEVVEPITVTHPVECDAESWGAVLKLDFIRMFCGPLIAKGTARSVYEMTGQPNLVIKVELTEGTFQNIAEWQNWSSLQFTPWSQYLAPCRRISPCGHILIQERTVPLEDVPLMLPDFFEDLKHANFGILNGRVVCHDYALTNLHERAITATEMRDVAPEEWTLKVLPE